MDDLLRLKQARISALENELQKLKNEIEFLNIQIQQQTEFNSNIYN